MNVGMLWFDNDPKAELIIKVERAADYYQNKYGNSPNLCFVHPSMLAATTQAHPLKSGSIEIRSSRSVLPNHFWIGINGLAGASGS